ncbi:2-succinyl-6-hydroxy-2,4-cyclohexadiene-1-carboxylate synthase [Virgibacillus sp. LDC-1]|uniref:2-succinyl-6-hydroxy-2, 4-cyclohexadiene-1-carboxylate synthase n=1 Tax=Virgibacillus sp. LDC-1 TaxID=3039856 RepID=UPI0024DEB87A|nr:2-succinyl-6-hydroxy-2,4-cyclohexadiene-1-carboxylate synthase [Virgibacillus sp. LDC-1]
MQFAVNDTIYWYDVKGKGVPIVLLHGFTGSNGTWESFKATYAAQYMVITIDLPGHGKTISNTPKTMEACCHDLNELFCHLKLSKIHLVGYSMGGRAALSFAMLYSEMIQTLTLESASPGLHTEEERSKRKAHDDHLAARILKEGLEKFLRYWEQIPLFHSQRRLPEPIQEKLHQERFAQEERGLANSLRFMGTGCQPSWWEELKGFTNDVLLLVGELDEKFIGINQEMHKLFPNSKLTIVPDAGHAIHLEQPDIFGKLVTDFILKSTLHRNNEEENDDCTMGES